MRASVTRLASFDAMAKDLFYEARPAATFLPDPVVYAIVTSEVARAQTECWVCMRLQVLMYPWTPSYSESTSVPYYFSCSRT